ncbi:MAG: hypothetical protein LUD77_01850 [Clostridiales bacterium]|nr:hypothetical protein [Clostridiales bacterium]
MKKFSILPIILLLAFVLGACGESKPDLSLLKGSQIVSEDESVSIILPDDTFETVSSEWAALDFESENKGYISAIKEEDFDENSLYESIPETEEELLALYENVDADVEVRNFNFKKKMNGTKVYTSTVILKNYVEYEEAEPENFIILENLSADGDTYYYATAEIYDESLIDTVTASLYTFGDYEPSSKTE